MSLENDYNLAYLEYSAHMARENLLDYCRFIDDKYKTPAHIIEITKKLTEVEAGKIKRIFISLPPRHGKSELISKKFLTWVLGRNPRKQIILCSYSSDLAEEFTGESKCIIESPKYQTVFYVTLRQDTHAKALWKTEQGGVVIGAGISGPITGKGGDLIIIDDPIKSQEEADSPVILEKIWRWYKSTLRTRLEPGGVIVIVMTRWRKGDLIGRLKEKMLDGGEKWEEIKLPAISLHGKALWPERFPLSELRQIEKNDEETWNSLYQQEPKENVNAIFVEPSFREPPKDGNYIFYLDPAMGGRDNSAFVCGCVWDKEFYIKYGYVWNKPLSDTYQLVFDYYVLSGAIQLFIEDNVAQKAILDMMRTKGLNPTGVTNTIPKHIRIIQNVRQNWNKIHFGPDVEDNFLNQILNYENPVDLGEKKSKYLLDAPDALAGLINKLNIGTTTSVKEWL